MQPRLIGDRYRVREAVGRGGMGTVWLCRDERLRRDVAVKQVGLLPGESVTDSARALREARSSAALSHPHVVTVFDVVEEGGAIWLVMEYVPSRSLSDLVAAEGPLEPALVADIGAQVAEGLAAAHRAGVMHRDVKPGNVLVREDGWAKISDFGIARATGDPALTQSGLVTGTPAYFSPELAQGAAPTPASDVWALGATLYAAVEGHAPYAPQRNPIAVLHDIASHQPAPPRRAGVLEPALLRMLDREAGSRWGMDDAAHALRRLVDSHRSERTLAQTRAWARETQVPAKPPHPQPATRPQAAPLATGHGGSRGGGSRGGGSRGGGSQSSGPSRDSSGATRGRGLQVLLGALAALLVLAAVGYVLTRDGADNDRRASGDPTGSPRSSPSGTRSSGASSPAAGRSASSSPTGREPRAVLRWAPHRRRGR